jgi:hypothetical protein
MVTTGGLPLAGVELKRFWAGRYVDTLNRQVKQFLKDHRGKITDTYVPPQGGYMRFVDAPQSDPPDEWSLLLDDIAHNFRSCLDHLAWQLAIARLRLAVITSFWEAWPRSGVVRAAQTARTYKARDALSEGSRRWRRRPILVLRSAHLPL